MTKVLMQGCCFRYSLLQSVLAPELSPKINLVGAIEKHFATLGDFELPEITREPKFRITVWGTVISWG